MSKNNLIFINNINEINLSKDSILFEIDCKFCDTKENLFKYFSEQLEFPDYFGKNWDAFDECVHDLEWIKDKTNKKIVYIYIYNLKELLINDTKQNKEIFLQIVNTDDIYIDEFNNPVEVHFVFNNLEKEFYMDIEH